MSMHHLETSSVESQESHSVIRYSEVDMGAQKKNHLIYLWAIRGQDEKGLLSKSVN